MHARSSATEGPSSRGMLPRVALLAFLLLAGSCSTFRAYEGPERPRSEVARISEMSAVGGVLTGDYSTTSIMAVDGVSIAGHPGSTVEVLPGHRELRVEGELDIAVAGNRRPEGTLRFEAAPGGEYELWLGFGANTTPYLLLKDMQTMATVASTEPTLEQLRTADVALDGREWEVVSWAHPEEGRLLMLAPAGQSAPSWQELLGQYARPTSEPAAVALDREVASILADAAAHRPAWTATIVDSDPSLRVVESRGPEGEDGPEQFTLTCVRHEEGHIHRLSYAARSEATYRAARDRWLTAFTAAKLRWPEP